MVITDDHPPGVVIEESLRGYKMGERTIRPARVKVTTKQPEESNNY
jgi:molecular chaperone GrpE